MPDEAKANLKILKKFFKYRLTEQTKLQKQHMMLRE